MSEKILIQVKLKPEVLDPQGQEIKKSLNRVGYSGVTNVRVGKSIELSFDKKPSESELKDICENVLSNPVIEVFRYES